MGDVAIICISTCMKLKAEMRCVHYPEAVQGMVQTMDVIPDVCLVSKY